MTKCGYIVCDNCKKKNWSHDCTDGWYVLKTESCSICEPEHVVLHFCTLGCLRAYLARVDYHDDR